MKCPKCGYVSHDYVDACRKCQVDLVAFKQELHLHVLQPGELDVSEVMHDNAERFANQDSFDADADFLGTQVLVDTEEMTEDSEEEFDIVLDDEPPGRPPPELTTSTQGVAAAQERSEQQKIPDVAASTGGGEREEVVLELDAAQETTSTDTARPQVEPHGEQASQPPVKTMATSDLADVDDNQSFEEPVIELDAPDCDQGFSSDLALLPALEGKSPSAPEAPPAASETLPDFGADDLTEAEPVLELAEEEDRPSSPEEHGVEGRIELEEFDLDDDEKPSSP